MLEAGDKVPADLRLIETRGLRIEEAVLTGESLPVDKQKQPVEADAALGDRASDGCSAVRSWPRGPGAGSWWQPARTPKSDGSAG